MRRRGKSRGPGRSGTAWPCSLIHTAALARYLSELGNLKPFNGFLSRFSHSAHSKPLKRLEKPRGIAQHRAKSRGVNEKTQANTVHVQRTETLTRPTWSRAFL